MANSVRRVRLRKCIHERSSQYKCRCVKPNKHIIKEETDPLAEITGEDKRKQILYEFHDAPLGGHRGTNKTYKAIKSKFHWPDIKKEIE
jgi:hypothetical protein